MEALARVGDHAGFDEGQHVIHEERVDAEVMLARESFHDGLGNRPHPDLHGGAVGDELGHVPGNRALDLAHGSRRILHEGMLGLRPAVDLERWRKALPSVRGILGLTWAITQGARRAATRP